MNDKYFKEKLDEIIGSGKKRIIDILKQIAYDAFQTGAEAMNAKCKEKLVCVSTCSRGRFGKCVDTIDASRVEFLES